MRPPLPSPPSNQSMTGSAYSGKEAVKMITVYQEETYSKRSNESASIAARTMREFGSGLLCAERNLPKDVCKRCTLCFSHREQLQPLSFSILSVLLFYLYLPLLVEKSNESEFRRDRELEFSELNEEGHGSDEESIERMGRMKLSREREGQRMEEWRRRLISVEGRGKRW